MPNRVSSILTACALALGPGAAWAQAPARPAAPTAVAPVTVEAAPPKVLKRQAQSFVEAYSVGTPKLDLIGRWREPICVKVVNLTPEQAALVKARVEQVARGLGLQVRKPGCTSNIQIVLTSQPQAFLDKVAKADEYALGFHWRSDLAKAKTVTHPIQGWYKTATQSAHFGHDGLPFANLTSGPVGNPMAGAQAPAGSDIVNSGSLFGESHASETLDIAENGSPSGCAGSLINHCERSVFKNVLVVIDSRAVEGKELGALADYLAMASLSQAKSLDGCNSLPSILDLMAKAPCAGRDTPDGLTAADATFLTALYSANPEARAASEQVDIAGRMSEALIKASSAAQAGAGSGAKNH